ncbi:MAG TPA: hypothetical protein VF876_03590 [Burkholderiales bacterium]
MDSERPTPQDELEAGALVEGVVFAALLSIPLWAVIAGAGIALFQEGPLTALQSGLFMLAAAVEALLLRYVWRRHALKERILGVVSRTVAPEDWWPVVRRVAFLGGLVAAFLHYYYWDVQLQIAQLNRVTVFI